MGTIGHPPLARRALSRAIVSSTPQKVVDPFVGSGTTLVAAQDLGRNAIGADLSREYVDLSNSRLGFQEEAGSHQIAVVQMMACPPGLSAGSSRSWISPSARP